MTNCSGWHIYDLPLQVVDVNVKQISCEGVVGAKFKACNIDQLRRQGVTVATPVPKFIHFCRCIVPIAVVF